MNAEAFAWLQLKYSEFMHGIQQQNINMNRKMLSELAMNEPHSFKALVEQIKFMRSPGPNAAQEISRVAQQ